MSWLLNRLRESLHLIRASTSDWRGGRITNEIANHGLGADDSTSGLPLRASESQVARSAFLTPTQIEQVFVRNMAPFRSLFVILVIE